MMEANTSAMSHPPYCVSGPLWNTRHSRPVSWMRMLVSRPGSDAYCGFSLGGFHAAGGRFHPGMEVGPAGGGGVVARCSSTVARLFEGVCADEAKDRTSIAPRNRTSVAPRNRGPSVS